MAVCSTLMARATTVGPGGRARTAWRSSSSHCRTTLSLADGGDWSRGEKGGGVGVWGGGGGRAGGPGVRAGGGAGDRQGHGQDGQQDERQPLLHGPPPPWGCAPGGRGDAASRAGADAKPIRNWPR